MKQNYITIKKLWKAVQVSTLHNGGKEGIDQQISIGNQFNVKLHMLDICSNRIKQFKSHLNFFSFKRKNDVAFLRFLSVHFSPFSLLKQQTEWRSTFCKDYKTILSKLTMCINKAMLFSPSAPCWSAKTWCYSLQADHAYQQRHVILTKLTMRIRKDMLFSPSWPCVSANPCYSLQPDHAYQQRHVFLTTLWPYSSAKTCCSHQADHAYQERHVIPTKLTMRIRKDMLFSLSWPCVSGKTCYSYQADHAYQQRHVILTKLTMCVSKDMLFSPSWPCVSGKTCYSQQADHAYHERHAILTKLTMRIS